MKIKKIDIALVMIMFAIFKMEGIPTAFKDGIQIFSLLTALLMFVSQYKIAIKDISFLIIVPVVFSTVYSYLEGNINTNNVLNCFFYMFSIWMYSNIIGQYYKIGQSKRLIKIMKNILLFFSILTIISILTIGVADTGITTYLFGGKFICCYLIILTIVFIIVSKKRMKIIPLMFLMSMSIMFNIYFSCSTGIIITVLLFFLLIVPDGIKKILCNPIVVLVSIIASGGIIMVIELILQNSIVNKFIVEVLGKDISLSGRMPIYSYYLFPAIKNNPIVGYGYGSAILHKTTPYWNAQNGLLDYSLNFGIIGALALLILFYFVFKSNKGKYWPMYSYIYILIVAAIWECSFNMFLYIILILIYHLNGGVKNEISS